MSKNILTLNSFNRSLRAVFLYPKTERRSNFKTSDHTKKAMAQDQVCELSTLRNQGAFVIPERRSDVLP